jgi:hypothetical protein
MHTSMRLAYEAIPEKVEGANAKIQFFERRHIDYRI